jgi:hypothetical protein
MVAELLVLVVVAAMMKEGDILRIQRDVPVVHILFRQLNLVMTDRIVGSDDRLSAVFTDEISVSVQPIHL